MTMDKHVKTLRGLRSLLLPGDGRLDALDAAIDLMEGRDAEPTRMSVEELRDACEQAARELWGEEAFTHCREISRVRNWWTASAGLVLEDSDHDALASVDECHGERDALEQILAALLVRLAQRGGE